MTLPAGSVLRALAIGALAAFSLPGVQAARAEADLLPPAKQLFAYDAKTSAQAPRRAATSCAAGELKSMRMADAGRHAAMARINELVAAGPPGEVVVLNGRGYGYAKPRDPALELFRIQQEAKRLQAARAR
jgi:hypothetical protein